MAVWAPDEKTRAAFDESMSRHMVWDDKWFRSAQQSPVSNGFGEDERECAETIGLAAQMVRYTIAGAHVRFARESSE